MAVQRDVRGLGLEGIAEAKFGQGRREVLYIKYIGLGLESTLLPNSNSNSNSLPTTELCVQYLTLALHYSNTIP